MRIEALVQARMSSERLPGKVLMPLAGRPALGWVLDRLGLCRELDGIAVATSSQESDDPVAAWCERSEVRCVRGPLEDVAGRFAAAAKELGLGAFVRISGDSPLIDPALVDEGVALFRSREPDLATNVHPRTCPHGQSVEVVRTDAFAAALPRMSDPLDREHVTRFIYANASGFDIAAFGCEGGDPDLRLALDTPEDAERIERVLGALAAGPEGFGWREAAALA